jgi:hypothetical protein
MTDPKVETAQVTLDPIMAFFSHRHLPEPLQTVSERFQELALFVSHTLPRCAERTVALRKLLEGKDAAVRAALECLPPDDR